MCVQQGEQLQSPEEQHWYGSEEFLALPAQLHKTELLALKLESLAQSLPLVSQNRSLPPLGGASNPSAPSCLQGRGDSTQEALQDVDDWDLMEVNPDCEVGPGSSPSPLPQVPQLSSLVGLKVPFQPNSWVTRATRLNAASPPVPLQAEPQSL